MSERNSDSSGGQKTRGQDFFGLGLAVIGGFTAVSIFLSLRGQESSNPLTLPVDALVGAVGHWAGLVLSLGLAGLGVTLFLRIDPVSPTSHLLGWLGAACGVCLMVGSVSADAGGVLGGLLPGWLGSSVGLFVGLILGLVVMVGSVWTVWLNGDPRPFKGPAHGAMVPIRGSDTEGVSAAEALALQPVRASTPQPGAPPAEKDVRLKGGVPPGTQPLVMDMALAPEILSESEVVVPPSWGESELAQEPKPYTPEPVEPVEPGSHPAAEVLTESVRPEPEVRALDSLSVLADAPAEPILAPSWERFDEDVVQESALFDEDEPHASESDLAAPAELEEEEEDDLEEAAELEDEEEDLEEAAELEEEDEELEEEDEGELGELEEEGEDDLEAAAELEDEEEDLEEAAELEEEDEELEEEDEEPTALAPADEGLEPTLAELDSPAAVVALLDHAEEGEPEVTLEPTKPTKQRASRSTRAKPGPQKSPTGFEQVGLFDNEDEPEASAPEPSTEIEELANAEAVEVIVPAAPVAKAPPEPKQPKKSKKGDKPKKAGEPESTDSPVESTLEPAAALGPEGNLFEAGRLIIEENRVAVSMLQRRFSIEFGDACEMLDRLQEVGLIGPYVGGRNRDILLTAEQWETLVSGATRS